MCLKKDASLSMHVCMQIWQLSQRGQENALGHYSLANEKAAYSIVALGLVFQFTA